MDYKATLNLPQTPFPMKANLPQREQELLVWHDMQLYTALRQQGGGKRNIFCMMGLPIQWRLHDGHVLNKILQGSR
jgi:isoleucyl-tRNA synthetase